MLTAHPQRGMRRQGCLCPSQNDFISTAMQRPATPTPLHSTAHEALDIFRGQARARLGGPNGQELMLYPGDVLVLPAGVGHASLEADDDFCMVGAYPPDQKPEIERGDPAQLAAAKARVAAVALPEDSPAGGSLAELWREDS